MHQKDSDLLEKVWPERGQIMRKQNRTGKGLHLFPLLLGGYAVFLGFGLVMIGLSEMKEGIGIIRLLIGLGMAGFGLLGIWDGVRDLARPEKKADTSPVRQFILTDISGIKSSHVTPELLRKQMDALAESEYKRICLQILPPLSVGEYGMLEQISCIYHGGIILIAYFEMQKDGYRILQKSTEPDMAEEWLKQLLAGNPDFAGWENVEIHAHKNEEDTGCDEEDIQQEEDEDTYGEEEDADSEEQDGGQDAKAFFLNQLWDEQNGQPVTYWNKLLVVFGESWHNELKFFSARDVELAVEGICEGKYQKAILEWGWKAVILLPGVQNDMMVIWCTNHTGKENTCFLAKEGTMTQVKFWMVGYMNSGSFERGGWTDVTDRMEKEKRKGDKKHGKVF